MQRVLEIQQRISKGEELYDLIGAVRALAAVRVRHAQEGAVAIATYAGIVSQALSQTLALQSAPPTRVVATGPRLLVVFGAEHGFVGGFNDRLLDAAVAELDATAATGLAVDQLAVIGERCATMAEERGLAPMWRVSAPTHRDAIERAARQLAIRVHRAFAGQIQPGQMQPGPKDEPNAASPVPAHATPVSRVDLLYMPYVAAGGWREPRVDTLLPLSLAGFMAAPSGRVSPLHHLAPNELLERFIDEYVLAELARVTMAAFASENWARLQATNQAHSNIEGRLDELRALAHRLRQEEITTEILDVIVGTQAVQR